VTRQAQSSSQDVAVGLSSGQELGAGYIRGCLQGALAKGYDPIDLLRAAQIDISVYSNPEATINGEQLQRLIMTIRRSLNDEYLGFLEVQGKLEMGYMVSRAAVRCATFGQAVTKVVKLVNAVRSDITLSFEPEHSEDTVAIAFQVQRFSANVEPHFVSALNLFWVYKWLCWMIGERIRLAKVGFSSGRPDGAIDFCSLFECPVEFDRESSRLYFSKRYLGAPIVRNEIELRDREFSFGQSDWFAIPGKDQSISTHVEQLLLDLYRQGRGPANLDVLSDMLCCSPRTLSRRLQRENVTFQDLKVKVRRELAQKLLMSTEMSITEIAEMAGFAEPADFTRAYVAWTGQTPSHYRAQRRSAGPLR
jgi:AraC-like DNA-binding protein